MLYPKVFFTKQDAKSNKLLMSNYTI